MVVGELVIIEVVAIEYWQTMVVISIHCRGPVP